MPFTLLATITAWCWSIFFYGSGIKNTLIYRLAAIALALLVNPLGLAWR